MKNLFGGLSTTLTAALILSGTHLVPVSNALAASGSCSVQTDPSGSLRSARKLYGDRCEGYALRDCDPLGGGGWICSSQTIGRFSPDFQVTRVSTPTPVPAPVTPAPVPEPVPAPLPAPQPAPVDSESCHVIGSSLQNARQSFAQRCSAFPRKDCDPRAQGQWVCSSENITDSTQFAGLANAPMPTVPPVVVPDTPATPPVPVEQPSAPEQPAPTPEPEPTPTTPANPTTVGRLAANDLLALHYDNCPDRDDGHALPAGKAVVESLGITNVMVVNGTCGNSIRSRFNPASNAVVSAVWGDEYLDADGARAAAVSAAATRWASTLSNGASVWVAEGGQSDFTADVVRRIESQFPGNNLKNIHVIQHSAGRTAYNELFTNAGNLSYLQERTQYQAIPNGNVGGNGSADLNEQSSTFVAIARSSRYSAEWAAAFNYLRPDCAVRSESCKLDFSDTVEVLYIVDDRRTRTVVDFANNYLR